MTDRDAAPRFDALLDGGLSGESVSDPLAAVAATVQELDLRQRAVPSDTFRAQLRQSLFGSANGTYAVTAADEPVALSPSRPPARKTVQPKKSRHIFDFAAALLVLIVGLGVVMRVPIGSDRDPEPSAIPAAAITEASPSHSPGGANGTPTTEEHALPSPNVPLVVVNDAVFFLGTADGFSGLIAQRASDSKRLWMVEGAPTGELKADDNAVYVSFDTADWQEARVEAHSVEDGDPLWSWDAGGNISGLAVADGTVYVVATDGKLTAIDAESGEMRWRTELDSGVGMGAVVWGDRSVDVSGEYVVALSPGGTLSVVNVSDGSVVWSLADRDPSGTTFAVTTSAVVVFERQTISYPSVGTPGTVSSGPMEETSTFWQMTTYDLAFGGFFGSRSIQELSVQPVAIGNLVAIPGTTIDRSAAAQGWVTGLFGVDGRGGGIVASAMPELLVDKRITQLGTWTPPDGAPEQFVAVTEDGLLTLIAPRHLGVVDDPDLPDPHDGAMVDLGQPAISAPVGDENGIWVVLADGTLGEIHPSRLTKSVWQEHEGTPLPEDETDVAWIALPPDGTRGQTMPVTLVDGIAYRLVSIQVGWPRVEAVDLTNGDVRWGVSSDVWPRVVEASDSGLLIAGEIDTSPDSASALTLLDRETGRERWRVALSHLPVALLVVADKILVLGADDTLLAFDLETQQKVWEADLSSKVQPTEEPSYLLYTGERLAETGGIVGAIASDGSLVAIGLDQGDIRWDWPAVGDGRTDVVAMNGAFVVLAMNRGYASGWTSSGPGTNVTVDEERVEDPCPLFIVRPVDATELSASGNSGNLWGILAVDPDTGAPLWSNGVQSWISLWGTTDASLIGYYPRSGGSGVIQPNSFLCAVDGATGAATLVTGPIPEAFGHYAYRDEDGVVRGLAVLNDGLALPVPLDEALAESLLLLDFDPAPYGGIQSVHAAGGAVYVFLRDGTLIKLDAPDEP